MNTFAGTGRGKNAGTVAAGGVCDVEIPRRSGMTGSEHTNAASGIVAMHTFAAAVCLSVDGC